MSRQAALQRDKSYGPCGCMGKQGNDPYCPCEMRVRGLERSGFSPPITPAEKVKLGQMFNKDLK